MKRACVSFVLTFLLASSVAAQAHSTSEYYPTESKWSASHHTGLNITWRFTPGFPSDQKKDRMSEAFGTWNAVGEPVQFTKLSDASSGYNRDCGADHPYHGIFWLTIDGAGGSRAETLRCRHQGGPAHNITTTFDANENWHGGSDQGGASEDDFGGAAAHEVGHWTGWSGHFGATWDVCTGSNQATMCPLYGELVPRGYRWLEEHDTHTYTPAY